jgi:dihydrofolate reductase
MTQPSVPVLCIIVATAENGVIGKDGKMPWHLPSELKYFRARTIGKPVVMGRKTFLAIGKPLPGRDNIVVTRDPGYAAPGIFVAHALADAIAIARTKAAASGATEIMVIGGAEIYAQALPLAQRVYLTRIACSPDGDAHFPSLPLSEWRLMGESTIPPSAAGEVAATACIYERT